MPSDLIRGWIAVRVKKTRQNKKIEPRSDSIGTEKALAALFGFDLLSRHFQGGDLQSARTCKSPQFELKGLELMAIEAPIDGDCADGRLPGLA